MWLIAGLSKLHNVKTDIQPVICHNGLCPYTYAPRHTLPQIYYQKQNYNALLGTSTVGHCSKVLLGFASKDTIPRW